LAAAVVALVLAEYTDAGFIFAVLILNAGLGTFQEWNAERSAAGLQKLLTPTARVRRSGVELTIPSRELVPGDAVLIGSGDRVPADLRLVQANNLTIDESFLTGESIAPRKGTNPLPEDAPIGDRRCMAFAGSMVMTGRGFGVVVTTGSQTQVGQIAYAVTFAEGAKPPLLIRMERFARQISIIVGIAVVLLGVIGVLKGMLVIEVFFLAVALAVSAIPEGLPVAMTVALSIAVRRMARRHVIVRKLPAVEGLGSCTCIASDKTGTLTVNQQTARVISLPGDQRLSVSGEGYAGEGEVTPVRSGSEAAAATDKIAEDLTVKLGRAGVLCSEGSLSQRDGSWQHRGDAMDVAFLALGYKLGLNPEQVRRETPLVGQIFYESELKFAAVFHEGQGELRATAKGSVETVLTFCDGMHVPTGVIPLDRDRIEHEALALARDGYRVLAVAEGRIEGDAGADRSFSDKDLAGMVLLGLVGFIDPLRPEVALSVANCQKAGIRVVMITGDHPATAIAIAQQLGIAHAESEVVIGSDLERLGSADSPAFLETVGSSRVFARIAPLQKLEVVRAIIHAGHFVAVTGDGVNDAPALKQANVGVAMGSGTEVAKDTASIIIADDNFASIEAGVEEGRFAYDNIRKVTYLLISCGLAEVILFAAAIAVGLPLPLLAVQLLWLNLVTNGIQDVALAFEKGEPGAMRLPPRKPSESVFNRLMVEQTLVSGVTMAILAFGTWYTLIAWGVEENRARNMLLLLFVFLQNVHVFNCRSERVSAFRVPLGRNYLLVAGVLAAQGVHLACMHFPPMQKILGIGPVTLREWGVLLGLALVMIVVMETFKLVRPILVRNQDLRTL
jgi:magnesium-transporting ATPase (P-type)